MKIHTIKDIPKYGIGKYVFAISFNKKPIKICNIWVNKRDKFWGYFGRWQENKLSHYVGFGPFLMLYWQAY